MKCDECQFYDETCETFGRCRRCAPGRRLHGTPWPEVMADDWCGEFRPRVRVATPIDDFLDDLPIRARKIRRYFRTVEQLLEVSEDQLYEIKNLGITSIASIKDKLTERGLGLSPAGLPDEEWNAILRYRILT